jgi:hypothetical protein
MRPVIWGIVLVLVGCSANGAPPVVRTSAVDDCYVDRYGWLRQSLQAAFLDQRQSLCHCLQDAASDDVAEVVVALAPGASPRVQLPRTTLAPSAGECLVHRVRSATTNWLARGPGTLLAPEEDRPADVDARVVIDWEGLACAPAGSPADPGPPSLSPAWIEAHPDGIVCPGGECVPPPRCRKPAHVLFRFPVRLRR